MLGLRLRKRQLCPRKEEVVDEVLTRLSELREIREDGAVAASTSRSAPKPPGPLFPPVPRVTARSVPILDNGLSAVFCAWSSPRVSALIATTNGQPTMPDALPSQQTSAA